MREVRGQAGERRYVIQHGGNLMGKNIIKIQEYLSANPNTEVEEMLKLIKNPPATLDGTKLCCARLVRWKSELIEEMMKILGI